MKKAVWFCAFALIAVSLRAEPYKRGAAAVAAESEAKANESADKPEAPPTRHPYWRDGAPKWAELPSESAIAAQDTSSADEEAKKLYKWGINKEKEKPAVPDTQPAKSEIRTPMSAMQPTDNWPVTEEEAEEAQKPTRDTPPVAKTHAKKEKRKKHAAPAEEEEDTRGVIFRVQVLATKDYLLDEEIVQYFKRYKLKEVIYVFEQTTDNGGYPYKYLVGKFRVAAEAQRYVSNVRKLGLKDAFVVCYYNNQRIPIQEGLLLQNNKR